MKLLNFHPRPQVGAHLGALLDGKIFDLTKAFPRDLRFRSVSALLRGGPESLRRARRRIKEGAGRIKACLGLDEIHYAAPIDELSRIFCVGLNYADHAADNKLPPP